MTELATHSTDYSVVESEPPEVMARNLRIASHLWSSATAFFFAAFLFAYFYLRSLDSSTVWRPKHVDPSFTLGTLATLALVGAAVLLRLGLADHRAERRSAWRIKGAGTLVLLVCMIVLQIIEWSTQGFGPTDGPYASVYLGWTGLLTIFVVGLATGSRRRSRRRFDTATPNAGRCRRATAQATLIALRRTLRTPCRSSAPSSKPCRSSRSSSRGSPSSPGSSST